MLKVAFSYHFMDLKRTLWCCIEVEHQYSIYSMGYQSASVAHT